METIIRKRSSASQTSFHANCLETFVGPPHVPMQRHPPSPMRVAALTPFVLSFESPSGVNTGGFVTDPPHVTHEYSYRGISSPKMGAFASRSRQSPPCASCERRSDVNTASSHICSTTRSILKVDYYFDSRRFLACVAPSTGAQMSCKFLSYVFLIRSCRDLRHLFERVDITCIRNESRRVSGCDSQPVAA